MKTVLTIDERVDLRTLLENNKMNRVLGAVDIGVSLPTLNNILSPSHKGDYATFTSTARKVRSWMARMAGEPAVQDIEQQVRARARKRRTGKGIS